MLTTPIFLALVAAPTPAPTPPVADLLRSTVSQSTVRIDRLRTFENLRVTAVAPNWTGSKIAVATEDGRVRIMDAARLTTLFTMQLVRDPAYALAFNRAGTALAVGDETARITLFNVASGQKVRELPRDRGHQRGIQALAFNTDGTRIASVGKDDTIRVWRTAGGNPVATILGNGANLFGVAWTNNGGLLTGTLAEGARLYSAGSFSLAAKMTLPGGQGSNNVTLNRAGTAFLTAGRDGRAGIWNLSSRQRVGWLQGAADWVNTVAYSPNGRLAATGSSDGNAYVYLTGNASRIMTIPQQSNLGSQVAFTGDGRFLITTNSFDNLQVWSVNPPQR